MIRDYRSNFEHIWIYYKGERAIFLRTTKTFGSPFNMIIVEIERHCLDALEQIKKFAILP